MGIIVFIGFCLIVVCAIIGASWSSDNTRNQHFHQTDKNPYLANGMDKADMELLMEDSDIRAGFGDEVETDFYDEHDSDLIEDDDGEFYGGIPFGDGSLFLTDDDDFLGEFGDDLL